MAEGTPAKEKRNQQIIMLKKQGYKLAEIARMFNISAQWAGYIYHREIKKVRGLDKKK